MTLTLGRLPVFSPELLAALSVTKPWTSRASGDRYQRLIPNALTCRRAWGHPDAQVLLEPQSHRLLPAFLFCF